MPSLVELEEKLQRRRDIDNYIVRVWRDDNSIWGPLDIPRTATAKLEQWKQIELQNQNYALADDLQFLIDLAGTIEDMDIERKWSWLQKPKLEEYGCCAGHDCSGSYPDMNDSRVKFEWRRFLIRVSEPIVIFAMAALTIYLLEVL